MRPSRNRYISTRVSDEEYARIEAASQGHLMSEWARSVLLDAATPGGHAVLLAEVLALRTILLNLHFAAYSGKPLTDDAMRHLIDRADREKWHDAQLHLAHQPRPVSGR